MGRRNGWGGESCGVERAVGWRTLWGAESVAAGSMGEQKAGLVRSAAAGRDGWQGGAGGGACLEESESRTVGQNPARFFAL